MPIRAVLFDLDNVLIDISPIYTEVSEQYFGSLSCLGRARYLQLVDGQPFAEWVHRLAKEAGMVVTPQLLVEIQDAIEERLPSVCRPIPRLVRMVRSLVGDELLLSVVTNNTTPVTLLALSYVDLRANFSAFITGADGTPKPAPDLWLLAAQVLGAPPTACLAIDNDPVSLASVAPHGMRTLCTSIQALCYEQVRAVLEKEIQ
mgnify:FL=1